MKPVIKDMGDNKACVCVCVCVKSEDKYFE